MWRWGVKWPEISETSFARSATLEDTSWARLPTELTRWNLPDSQLCLKSKTEPCVANAPNYIGGGTPHRKNVYWDGGGTPHILC